MLRLIFNLLASAVTLYGILCFVRIILTWFPGVNYSQLGRFLSTMCDPYMNLFSRLPLRIGGLDFSPMISIGLLTLLSSLLKSIAETGHFYLAGLISSLLSLVWGVASSFIFILLIALLIRFVVMLIKGAAPYSSIWYAFDNALSNIVYKIASVFTGRRDVEYRTALGLSILVLILLLVVSYSLVTILLYLLSRLPF